jgi:hypothetical protein
LKIFKDRHAKANKYPEISSKKSTHSIQIRPKKKEAYSIKLLKRSLYLGESKSIKKETKRNTKAAEI